MGGATQGVNLLTQFNTGLSPRGRGNPYQVNEGTLDGGSIPAWAGQPGKEGKKLRRPEVYPRVGGATRLTSGCWKACWGLSPRGRGNHKGPLPGRNWSRSIPAWAGQPYRLPKRRNLTKVYPRVGGATPSTAKEFGTWNGLSPRGRGNLEQGSGNHIGLGSIPAWAGQPLPSPANLKLIPVYPRVGGATTIMKIFISGTAGLSPRGRGNLANVGLLESLLGSIPAWAGQPGLPRRSAIISAVYPRVGGATWQMRRRLAVTTGLSPRGRGNLQLLY